MAQEKVDGFGQHTRWDVSWCFLHQKFIQCASVGLATYPSGFSAANKQQANFLEERIVFLLGRPRGFPKHPRKLVDRRFLSSSRELTGWLTH